MHRMHHSIRAEVSQANQDRHYRERQTDLHSVAPAQDVVDAEAGGQVEIENGDISMDVVEGNTTLVSEAPAVARRPAEDVSSVRPGSRQVLIVPPGRMAPPH